MPGKVHFQFADGPMKGKAFVFDEHDTFHLRARGRLPRPPAGRRHPRLPPPFPRRSEPARRAPARPRQPQRHAGQRPKDRRTEEGRDPEQGAKRRHPEIDLQDGDQLRVGNTVLQVKTETSPSAGPVCSEQVREEMARLIFDLNAADSPAARRIVAGRVGVPPAGFGVSPERSSNCSQEAATQDASLGGRDAHPAPRRRGPDQRR